MSSPNYTPSSRTQCQFNTSTKDTNTPDEFSLCHHCRRSVTDTKDGSSTIINDYIDSLQYINSCHVLINQIIQGRHPAQNVSIPQIPNFLNVLTYIAKDVRGLSELRSLDSLENLMQEMNMGDSVTARKLSPTRKSSPQAASLMSDKEVLTPRPEYAHAETSMKKATVTAETRVTGIPRRIAANSRVGSPKERNNSPSASNISSSEVSRLGGRRLQSTASSVVPQSRSPSPSYIPRCVSRDQSPPISELPELPSNLISVENSDKESVAPSNDDMDDYAKQLLLASDALQSALITYPSKQPRNKVRKVKTKAKRDFEMIKSFLKQWGIEMPRIGSESDESLLSPNGKNLNHKPTCDMTICKSPVIGSLPEEDSDLDTTMMEYKEVAKMATSLKNAKGSHESRRMNTFNDLAATAEGLENTFITNEKPVWQHGRVPFCGSDDSDIEPDLDDHINNTRDSHVKVVNGPSKPCKTVTFQTNTKAAAYVVTQKPKDQFLLPRRRRSHSDIESEQMLVDSDIEDEIFDKKRRTKSTLKTRLPVLPQKVLSNIGILTQTGKVKPERERQLQELRSRLATDMQTALFRKPRNRKQESDDIVLLHTDILSTNKH